MTRHRMVEILSDIKYKDWAVEIGYLSNVSYDTRCFLQVSFVSNGEWQYGRKWILSSFMTKSEFVQTVFKAILTAEEHEAREQFLYKGRAVYGPHLNVDDLVDISENLDVRTSA